MKKSKKSQVSGPEPIQVPKILLPGYFSPPKTPAVLKFRQSDSTKSTFPIKKSRFSMKKSKKLQVLGPRTHPGAENFGSSEFPAPDFPQGTRILVARYEKTLVSLVLRKGGKSGVQT